MSKAADDIAFALAKSGDEVADAAGSSAAKVIKNYNPSSAIAKMGSGSFYTKLELPEIPITSSKLFQTGENLTTLSKIEIDALVPPNTKGVLDSLSSGVDDTFEYVDDFATAAAKVNVPDSDLLKLAETESIAKLGKISDDLAEASAKSADDFASQIINSTDEVSESLLKSSNEVTETIGETALKNTDEMTDSLRASSKVDELAETTAKTGDGVIDDVVEQAKKDERWQGIADTMSKYDGRISLGILGAFMFSRHINGNAPWSTTEFQEELDDPIEVGEIELEDLVVDAEEIVANHVTTEVPEEGANNTLLGLGVVAATVAFMKL